MTEFEFFISVFGYATSGLASKEAVICEYRDYGDSMWDDPNLLDRTHVNGHRPPDWYSCYWIGEHVRRGHAVP